MRQAVPGLGPPCCPRIQILRPLDSGHPGTGCGGRCVFDGDARRGRAPKGKCPEKPRNYSLGGGPRTTATRFGRLNSDGIGDNPRMSFTIKTPEEIEQMRVAGRLAAEVLQVVAPYVKPGVSTCLLYTSD